MIKTYDIRKAIKQAFLPISYFFFNRLLLEITRVNNSHNMKEWSLHFEPTYWVQYPPLESLSFTYSSFVFSNFHISYLCLNFTFLSFWILLLFFIDSALWSRLFALLSRFSFPTLSTVFSSSSSCYFQPVFFFFLSSPFNSSSSLSTPFYSI